MLWLACWFGSGIVAYAILVGVLGQVRSRVEQAGFCVGIVAGGIMSLILVLLETPLWLRDLREGTITRGER